MTTVFKGKFKCVICETKFESDVLGSTNTFGGQDSEFRPHAVGIQPIPYHIQTCLFCGFTDYTHDMELNDEEKSRIKEYLNSYCTETEPKRFSFSRFKLA